MTATDELLPCPFCFGSVSLKTKRECYGHGDFGEVAYVECQSCYARGPIADLSGRWTREKQNETLAIRKWNTRVGDTE